MAFYASSRVPLVIPAYSDTQLTTTVPVCHHHAPCPSASNTRSVREYIASSSPPALRKPCYRHIPLPSQTGSDIPVVVHPLLRLSRGEIMMELDFARSLSGVRVFSHHSCVNKAATNPPLPSLAVVHPMLPWPVVIHRSAIESGLQLPTWSRRYGMLFRYLSRCRSLYIIVVTAPRK